MKLLLLATLAALLSTFLYSTLPSVGPSVAEAAGSADRASEVQSVQSVSTSGVAPASPRILPSPSARIIPGFEQTLVNDETMTFAISKPLTVDQITLIELSNRAYDRHVDIGSLNFTSESLLASTPFVSSSEPR